MSEPEKSLGLKVFNESLKLPFVKVNRSEFLMKTFGNEIDDKTKLISEGPQAFLSRQELDAKANNRITYIVSQSSALSFVAGIPGGFAMAATIPTDIAQFYGYALKLAQEISYIYGYDDIWNEQGELSEDAKNVLLLYLGIMLGVNSAGSAIRILSSKLSAQALKKIPQKALTKTIYYPIMKKVLAVFGTKLTKSTFAKGISKTIPVVGGIVSGSINYLSMKPMATKLQNELSKSINYNEKDLRQDLKILKDSDVKITSPDTDIDLDESEDLLEKIEKAHELLKKHIITEEEFAKIKKSLLSN